MESDRVPKVIGVDHSTLHVACHSGHIIDTIDLFLKEDIPLFIHNLFFKFLQPWCLRMYLSKLVLDFRDEKKISLH